MQKDIKLFQHYLEQRLPRKDVLVVHMLGVIIWNVGCLICALTCVVDTVSRCTLCVKCGMFGLERKLSSSAISWCG